jgi:cyclohexanone monooxygenase
MNTLPSTVQTLIIGSGFAGLGAAIRLDQSGLGDFLVVEKAASVGGTWRDNTYPGAACDVPSQLYSFSFALNPQWSSYYSPQPEIRSYIERVAQESGVLDRFAFNTAVEDATWDNATQEWVVATSAGTVRARFLISGSGGLSEPKLPEIDGIEDFAGQMFHSAQWDHDADLAGKRVAVIGTGASAIQIVPELQTVVGHLDVHQRTAPWIIPRNEHRYSKVEQLAMAKVPGLQRAYRGAIYANLESRVPVFTRVPVLFKAMELMAKRHIAKGISDPELRAKVTPDFLMGCKRILISNRYYPALAADNVDLLTDGIARITATGIETKSGELREVDAIIVCTGFHTTDQPIAHHINGRDGMNLGQLWSDKGQAAYKGTTVHGFPNFFQIVGPNTGLGHSSMVYMIESQVEYVVDALRTITAEGTDQKVALEPAIDVQQAWNDGLQRRMKPTVWTTGGCASWYLDQNGNNTTLWPRNTFTFRSLLASFDRAAYDVVPASQPAPKTPKTKKVSA